MLKGEGKARIEALEGGVDHFGKGRPHQREANRQRADQKHGLKHLIISLGK